MKKRNRMSKLYWLIPLIVVVLWFAVGAKAGIVRNGTSSQTGQDSLSVPLFALDTAGNRVEFDTTADWGYIVVRYPNGVKAVSDSFTIRGTNTPKIVKNAAEFGGFAQFAYRKQISDLDGTPINGTYSFEVTVRDSSLKLWTVVKNGEFQLYQTVTLSSLYDGQKYDNDSLVFGATLDNPSFLSPTTASRTLDVSATGEAGVDWGNVGSPTSTVGLTNTTVGTVTSATTASASNTAIGLATWNTAFGTAFTAGSMGDSLNGMQYSKVSQLIVANVDAAISSRGTSTLTATDNIGINWADVSNPTSTVGLTNTTVGIVTDLADNAIDSATFSSSAKTGLAFYVWNSATRTLTSAGSGGITEAEMWDMLDTAFVNAFRIAMGDTFATWSDSATVDRSSLVIVAGNFGSGAIDAAAIAADAIGSSEIADGAIDAGAIAADAIGSSELAATAANEIADQVLFETLSEHLTAGTVGAALDNILTAALLMYGDGVKLLAGGTEADTSFTNLQAAVAGISSGSGLDSATTSRILRRIVWGLGGTGTNTDSTTLAERTATASGTVTADIYPFNGIKLTIDAAGADPDAQFVVDTASLGGLSSHQATLVNRQLVVRSLSGIEVQIPTTINRVAYTGANCSLSVNMNMPIDFAAGDTIQLAGWPWHDFATVSEASDSNAQALLLTDLTGNPQDSLVRGFIKSGGVAGSDTTAQKAMLTGMGVPRGLDSLASLSETATADGTLRRGEIVTARAAAETTSVILADDSLLVKGGIIDTVLTATSVNLGSDSVFVKGGVVDTLLSQVAGSGGSCTGSGPIALTIVVYDSVRDVVVADARIGLYTTSAMSGDPSYYDVTGASGTLAFNVNSGTYYISGRAGAKTFEPAISVVATSSPTLDTVFCEGLPTSLFTYLYGQEILPDTLVGAVVTLELVNYSDTMNVNDLTINPYKYSTRVDVNGEWAIPNVLANSKFDANSRYVYRITHPRLSRAKSFEIEVPDTSQVNIAVLPKKKVQ